MQAQKEKKPRSNSNDNNKFFDADIKSQGMTSYCLIREAEPFEIPIKKPEDKTIDEKEQDRKKFWQQVDSYSELFIMGAMTWIAAQAFNNFIQSIIQSIVPQFSSQSWENILSEFIYLALVFFIFLGIATAYASHKKEILRQAKLYCLPSVKV